MTGQLLGPLVLDHGAVFDLKHLRLRRKAREGSAIRSGKPGLTFKRENFVEQSLAAIIVEMCRDIVEQEKRRHAPLLREKPHIGQHKRNHQCLLLARRAKIGGTVLRAVDDAQIAAVRARGARAVQGVLFARLRESGAQGVFDEQGGHRVEHVFGRAAHTDIGLRKGVAAFDNRRLQPADHVAARGADGRCGLRHFVF